MVLFTPQPHMSYSSTNSSVGAAASGTALTSGAATNSYGSWTQIHAGLTYESAYVVTRLSNTGASATTKNSYVDVGIGPDAANVTVVIEKLSGYNAAPANTGLGNVMLCPVRIPAGTPVWARHQANTASASISILATFAGGPNIGGIWSGLTMQSIVCLGAAVPTVGTGLTAGASGAEGSWTQIVASTTDDYALLGIGMFTNDTTLTGSNYQWDIAYGPAGSETLIAENVLVACAASTELTSMVCIPSWANIPAGSRIAVRASSSGAADTSLTAVVYAGRG